MKNLTKLILVFCSVIIATVVNAQDYKHPYGLVNKDGKITDAKGSSIGSITSTGVLSDASGAKIAHVDANGNMVDVKTGKVLGHASKNGTFIYHFKETNDTLTVGPMVFAKLKITMVKRYYWFMKTINR